MSKRKNLSLNELDATLYFLNINSFLKCPRKRLRVKRLVQVIQNIESDQEIRDSAATLVSNIRAENGLEQAIALIHQL